MALPEVAVVILNYNGKNFLQKFLSTVIQSTYVHLKVIVADNGSSDDSVAYIKANYPQVGILTNNINEGFAGGYNWALSNVRADYYVLLNSDVSVTPGWIEPIIALMENDPSIGACQPKILSQEFPELFEYAGACGGWIDTLGYPFSRGRVFDVCEKDNGQYNEAIPVFWASGAAMFVKAGVYHELGGLDASFFAHQEEIDLCWRMQLAGYRIMCCPTSIVYHVGAGTLPRGGKKVFLNFRNNLQMLIKNLPWQEKVWKIPARFALDAISAWKGLLTGDTDFFKAIMQAHFAIMRRWFTRPLNSSYPAKKLNQLEGVYPKSVVWQYFINHKRHFDEILGKKDT